MSWGTHDTYTHAEDGLTCILVEDGTWFIPYDVGGEGVDCTRHHGPKPKPEKPYPLEGTISLMSERHLPEENGCGCICGFVVWSPTHVAIMAYRDAVDFEGTRPRG